MVAVKRPTQLEKAQVPIYSTESGMVKCFKPSHSKKASRPILTTDDGIRKHDVTFDGNGNGSVSGDDEVELHYNVCENRGIQIFAQSPDGHNDILMGALAKGGGFLFATSAKGIDKHNGNQQDDEGPKFVIGIQKTGANDPSTSSYYDVSFITSDNAGYVKFK